MAAPDVGPLALELYEQLTGLAYGDEDHDWALLCLCQLLTWGDEFIDACVADRDGRDGWSQVLDPMTCPAPALPWLAMLNGVPIPPGSTEQETRDLISALPHFRRGHPDSIDDAIRVFLTGDKRVTRVERYRGDRWQSLRVTYAAQTPDRAPIDRILEVIFPAGIVWTYRVDLGWSIRQMHTFHAGETAREVATQYADARAFASVLPEVS